MSIPISRVIYQRYSHSLVSGVVFGNDSFVFALAFGAGNDLMAKFKEMNIELKCGELIAVKEIKEFLNGERKSFSVIPKQLWGTPFQRKAWSATRKIPYGTTISYAELAKLAGNPKAFRAAGSAMAANQIPLIIPCHRVIASDGGLGGFGGDLKLKKALLELEHKI